MKGNKNLIGTSIIAAIVASLCCITPVLALIAGTSGIASTFSWIEPFRPYLIALTVVILALAWYLKLKPRTKEEIECDCEEENKATFWQSKNFLGIVTVFAIIMLAFPYYSKAFYPDTKNEMIVVDSANIQSATINIEGMTCISCEEHVNYEVNKLDGILTISSSYEKGNAEVEFDSTVTTLNEIEKAINSTGYKVIE